MLAGQPTQSHGHKLTIVRDIRHQPARLLPIDVYLDIFVHIQLCADTTLWQFTHTMASLALTCKSFYAICHRRLYERVVLYHKTTTPQWHGKGDRLERWLDLLNAREPCALRNGQFVRSCTIWMLSWPSEYTDETSQIERSLINSRMSDPSWLVVIAAFKSLYDLTLLRTLLTGELIETLAALPQLRELRMRFCTPRGPPPDPLPNICGPGVTHLQCRSLTLLRPEWAIAIVHLVDKRGLRSLDTVEPGLISAIFAGQDELALEVLDMTGRPPMSEYKGQEETVSEGLTRCQNLREFFLEVIPSSLQLPPSVRSLGCPLAAAATLLSAMGEHCSVVHINSLGHVCCLNGTHMEFQLPNLLRFTPEGFRHLELPIEALRKLPTNFKLNVHTLTLTFLNLSLGSVTDEIRPHLVSWQTKSFIMKLTTPTATTSRACSLRDSHF